MSQGYNDETALLLKKSFKELAQNQSFVLANFRNHSRVVESFQQQLSAVSADVTSVKQSLLEAPQMVNIGKELDSLKSSLAVYEATIMQLKNSFAELKELPLLVTDITAAMKSMNSSQQNTLDSMSQSLDHQHVISLSILHEFCFLYFQNSQETLHSLKNKTEKLTQDSYLAMQRLDAAQTQLIKLEGQQKNLTLTLDYAMDALKELERSSG